MNVFRQNPLYVARLVEEWKNLMWEYFPRLAENASLVPVFEFMESNLFLGKWTGFPENRISLNQELLKRPWYVLQEVLRHEIAHQLTDLLHPGCQEPPHGPLFREIALHIGANPGASADTDFLDDRVFVADTHRAGGIDSTIQKLLALAESGTDHEAEAALCKAHELMAKHGISQEGLSESNFVTISVLKPMMRVFTEIRQLAALIHKFWPVEAIFCRVPFPEAPEKPATALFLCGTPENTRIASYVCDFICHHIEHEFIMNFAQRGLRQQDRHSFALGVIRGLFLALDKQTAQSREYALVLVKDAALTDYYHHRFPHTRSTRSATSIRNPDAFERGVSIGKNMTIAPGVDASNPQKRLGR